MAFAHFLLILIKDFSVTSFVNFVPFVFALAFIRFFFATLKFSAIMAPS